MINHTQETATLLLYCPDKEGIILAVTDFIFKNGGNVVELDQHTDIENQIFFMRVKWELSQFKIPSDKIGEYFSTLIAQPFAMKWQLHQSEKTPNIAVFVTKLSHCLYDIISRVSTSEWNATIKVIVSNHQLLEPLAKKFDIPFVYLPITTENKQEQEAKQLAVMQEYDIDLIVLARYMQIVSDGFIKRFPNKIINIHHSFLPAFPGARPYHSAFERGVKVIGATSHYVTEELDAGPIIEQDVTQVSHKNSIGDLKRKGRDLEKLVLSRAIYHHIQRKVLVYNNKTIVFD